MASGIGIASPPSDGARTRYLAKASPGRSRSAPCAIKDETGHQMSRETTQPRQVTPARLFSDAVGDQVAPAPPLSPRAVFPHRAPVEGRTRSSSRPGGPYTLIRRLTASVTCRVPRSVRSMRRCSPSLRPAAFPPPLRRRLAPPCSRLHRCRVGGGALDCPRAGLRPPLKLDVRVSRIQLSRRRVINAGAMKESGNQD